MQAARHEAKASVGYPLKLAGINGVIEGDSLSEIIEFDRRFDFEILVVN